MSDALHISHLNTPQTELSQARLAAEAAFLAPMPRNDADDGPVIVVKRKKAVVVDDHNDHGEDHEHSAESRAPKIYRVDHGSDSAAPEAADEPDEPPTLSGSHKEISLQPVAPLKRRRRVKRHGEVTIIRPQAPEGLGERVHTANTDEPADTSVEPVLTKKFGQEIASLKRLALADLAAVQSEIRKLERQAEAAKKAEAAQAVRWIRKAMAKYGLKLADLGL